MFFVQFVVFTPASVIVDIIRLSAVDHAVRGRPWLIFLQILEMVAKVHKRQFTQMHLDMHLPSFMCYNSW